MFFNFLDIFALEICQDMFFVLGMLGLFLSLKYLLIRG